MILRLFWFSNSPGRGVQTLPFARHGDAISTSPTTLEHYGLHLRQIHQGLHPGMVGECTMLSRHVVVVYL
jgi:hypothetical protein